MGYRVESCVAKDGRARLGGFRTALEITPWNMGSLSDDHPVEVHVEIGVDLLIFGVLYEYLYCVYLYLHLHLHISIFIFIYIYIHVYTIQICLCITYVYKCTLSASIFISLSLCIQSTVIPSKYR